MSTLQQGKIFSYDSTKGSGLILLEDGTKFAFDMDKWDIPQSTPKTGMSVIIVDNKVTSEKEILLKEKIKAEMLTRKVTFKEIKQYLHFLYLKDNTRVLVDEEREWLITTPDSKQIRLRRRGGKADGDIFVYFTDIKAEEALKDNASTMGITVVEKETKPNWFLLLIMIGLVGWAIILGLQGLYKIRQQPSADIPDRTHIVEAGKFDAYIACKQEIRQKLRTPDHTEYGSFSGSFIDYDADTRIWYVVTAFEGRNLFNGIVEGEYDCEIIFNKGSNTKFNVKSMEVYNTRRFSKL